MSFFLVTENLTSQPFDRSFKNETENEFLKKNCKNINIWNNNDCAGVWRELKKGLKEWAVKREFDEERSRRGEN